MVQKTAEPKIQPRRPNQLLKGSESQQPNTALARYGALFRILIFGCLSKRDLWKEGGGGYERVDNTDNPLISRGIRVVVFRNAKGLGKIKIGTVGTCLVPPPAQG